MGRRLNELEVLLGRLKRIGIELECTGNYPWIYLSKINGKLVTERFLAEHGFTIGWYAINVRDKMRLSDTKEIFKLIRKYV